MFTLKRPMKAIAVMGAALTLRIAGFQHGSTADAAHLTKAVPVKVTLRDFRVFVSRHQPPAGTPIKFVITYRGKATHELVLERAGSDDDALKVEGKKFEADDIAPGMTRTVTWTVPRAGKYRLACHMPGHFQMGMKTFITVGGHA